MDQEELSEAMEDIVELITDGSVGFLEYGELYLHNDDEQPTSFSWIKNDVHLLVLNMPSEFHDPQLITMSYSHIWDETRTFTAFGIGREVRVDGDVIEMHTSWQFKFDPHMFSDIRGALITLKIKVAA